jgi:DNA-directed RNA polymerase alpha subunit
MQEKSELTMSAARKPSAAWSSGAEGEGEMSKLLDPTPGLPNDTLIERVRLSTRIQNVLVAAGLKTVGEVREISDDTLLSFQNFGKGSVAFLRETLGLPSCDGVVDRSG